MPREKEPPKPPQNRNNPENPTPPQRREAEDSGQKERQGLMEYSEKDEEKLLKQLEKIVIEGEKNEYFPYTLKIAHFIDQHGIKNPFPLFRKLLESLTPEQALVLSHGIDGSQDKEYSGKLREKIRVGVNPEAILRHSSYTLPDYFSIEETEEIVKKAIFTLQTNDPKGDRVIYKYLDNLADAIPEEELQALAKETLEKIINSGNPESILQNIDERHFAISGDMSDLILKYTKKAISMLVSQGREEEVFNYALNYQDSFQHRRPGSISRIFSPIIREVLKNPTGKIYEALLSEPEYYKDLRFFNRQRDEYLRPIAKSWAEQKEFEDAIYNIALEAAKDRHYMTLLTSRTSLIPGFLGSRMDDIWDECEKTDPELFKELHGQR